MDLQGIVFLDNTILPERLPCRFLFLARYSVCKMQDPFLNPFFNAKVEEYLSKVKEYGLSVYLLEYRADRALSKQIDAYCSENGFLWYNADGIELR